MRLKTSKSQAELPVKLPGGKVEVEWLAATVPADRNKNRQRESTSMTAMVSSEHGA